MSLMVISSHHMELVLACMAAWGLRCLPMFVIWLTAALMNGGWECRAIMVQLGFFFHMKLAMGAPSLTLTRPLIFAISFMLLFSVVIALFKDIPDVKGDAQVR